MHGLQGGFGGMQGSGRNVFRREPHPHPQGWHGVARHSSTSSSLSDLLHPHFCHPCMTLPHCRWVPAALGGTRLVGQPGRRVLQMHTAHWSVSWSRRAGGEGSRRCRGP